VDCFACANWRWIWPLRDGAAVPARKLALVKGELASKDKTLLPLTFEAVLKHGDFLAVMRHVLWTASCFVCIDIVPFVTLIPIIVKTKTVIYVSEGILWHGFHARADCIKWLACRPTTFDQWILPQTLHNSASKKASNVISNNDLPINGIIVI
jgi:hypothetical protein